MVIGPLTPSSLKPKRRPNFVPCTTTKSTELACTAPDLDLSAVANASDVGLEEAPVHHSPRQYMMLKRWSTTVRVIGIGGRRRPARRREYRCCTRPRLIGCCTFITLLLAYLGYLAWLLLDLDSVHHLPSLS